jgi:hypothetical protein
MGAFVGLAKEETYLETVGSTMLHFRKKAEIEGSEKPSGGQYSAIIWTICEGFR